MTNGNNVPGTPGFDPGDLPTFTGPGQQELDLLSQFLGGIGPSGEFTAGTQGILEALRGGGGFSAIEKFLPSVKQAGQFLGGAGRQAKAFEEAQVQRLRQQGQAGLRNIRGAGGAAGRLGSTVQGVGEVDLLGRFLGERSNIAAQAGQLREQGLQQRLGTLIGGLGTAGTLKSFEQQNLLQGAGSLAQLGLQQQGLSQQQLLQGLGVTSGFRQEPFQAGLDLFGAQAGAPSTGGGGFFGGLADIFSVAAPFIPGLGPLAGLFGGGGGGGITQPVPQ